MELNSLNTVTFKEHHHHKHEQKKAGVNLPVLTSSLIGTVAGLALHKKTNIKRNFLICYKSLFIGLGSIAGDNGSDDVYSLSQII